MANEKKQNETFVYEINKIKISTEISRETHSQVDYDIEVKISEDDYNKIFDIQLNETVKTAQIKGFRPGKAPISIIKSKYEDSIRIDTSNKLIDSFFKNFLKDQDVVDLPKITDIDAKPESFRFSASVSVAPNITMPEWKDIEIEKNTFELKEENITEMIEEIKKRFPEFKVAEESYAAKSGDKLLIDFEGFIDGTAFPGGTSKDAELVLGSNHFIPGFEEQLIGAKANEQVTVKVTFPEDYGSKDHAGKDAEFKVLVKNVHISVPVEISDEYVKEKFNFENLEFLKEKLKEQRTKDLEAIVFEDRKTKLLDKLDSIIAFDIPKILYEKEYEATLKALKHNHKDHEGHDHKCDENIEKQAEEIAHRRIKLGLLLQQYNTQEKITVEPSEVENEILRSAAQYGPEYAYKYYELLKEREAKSHAIASAILENKIIDSILNKVTNIEVKSTVKEIENLMKN